MSSRDSRGTFHDKDGQTVDCYTIITTVLNEVMRPIHDRMPVILNEPDRGRWLEGGAGLDELIKPYEGPMEASHFN